MSNVSELCEIVDREIDDAREELVDLCDRLVAAVSINPPGRTAEVADVVRSYLAHHQVATQVVGADDEAPNVIGCIDAGVSGTPCRLQRAYGHDGSRRRDGLDGPCHVAHPP